MSAAPFTTYGIDVDRVGRPEPLPDAIRRRLDGRFPIDPFGADPQVQDLVAGLFGVVRVEVAGGERLPRIGPALIVSNRGLGVAEPAALSAAVYRTVGRRLRVVGAPDLPVLGGVMRKLGAIGARPDDVAAVLRAGHLAAVPLAPTWLRAGAGDPPRAVLAAALGFPVVPVAVVPGGPLGMPLRPWRVRVGEVIEAEPWFGPGDRLAAAELAETARQAIQELLAGG